MQSWQGCALHPARIVGQGSQCAAQHDAMPSVGAQDGVAVRLGVAVAEGVHSPLQNPRSQTPFPHE